jgi:hypothetical protein
MKSLFNKKKKLIKQLNEIGYLLDKEIEERWGFHYSQTDSDPMIDTLDYGTFDISYKDFVDRMDNFKEKQDKGEWFPNV